MFGGVGPWTSCWGRSDAVTEAEWLVCTNPKPMLRFLLGTNHPTASAYQTCVSDRTSVRNAVLAMHETILPRRLSFLG